MPRTAPGLTLLAEGTTIDGRRRSVRSPIVGKTGKEAITLLWAFCSLLMPVGRVAGGQEHGNHGVKGSLGTVEFRVSCATEAQESFTRGVATAFVHLRGIRRSVPRGRGEGFTVRDGALGTGDDGVPPVVGTLRRAGGIATRIRRDSEGARTEARNTARERVRRCLRRFL